MQSYENDIFVSFDMFSINGLMREGDSYMEIGAHYGRFLEGSKLLRPGCSYYLYEPGDRTRLNEGKQKYASAGINVEVYPEAFWSSNLTMNYHKDPSEGQGNTLIEGIHNQAYKVDTITLEQALDRHGIKDLRMLAINAEQAEYEILKSEAINRVQFITCEFHPGMSGIDTLKFVNDQLPQFETLSIGRMGDLYNQWLGFRR